MRNMSFAMTTEQVRQQSKTVTRRFGWWFLKPGDVVQPVVKGMGLKKGEKVEKIGGPIRIVSTRREPLNAITHRARKIRLASGRARAKRVAGEYDARRMERVVRLTIEDSMRPRQVLILRQMEGEEGRWSRFRVVGAKCRPKGKTGIGTLVAELIA